MCLNSDTGIRQACWRCRDEFQTLMILPRPLYEEAVFRGSNLISAFRYFVYHVMLMFLLSFVLIEPVEKFFFFFAKIATFQ